MQVIIMGTESAPSYTEAVLHQHLGEDADTSLGTVYPQGALVQPPIKHAAHLLGTLSSSVTRSKLSNADSPARGKQIHQYASCAEQSA